MLMIQAFARGFQERLLLLKRRRRVQCMWGVTCLAFAVRRYQRDRLAARTFQTSIRELVEMHKMVEIVNECKSKGAKDQLLIYYKVIKAQDDLKRVMQKRLHSKICNVVHKIGESWVH